MDEKQLIAACKKGNRKAQKQLYDQYSPNMMGVCLRYVGPSEAEDVLVEAFFKVFSHLNKFKGEGSFAGWIRRIVVNEALMHLRKRKRQPNTTEVENAVGLSDHQHNAQDLLQADDILMLLDQLPDGYRTVFNLYVLEGYKHREIAEKLNISINTSKSQLILARQRMREMLERIGYPVFESSDQES